MGSKKMNHTSFRYTQLFNEKSRNDDNVNVNRELESSEVIERCFMALSIFNLLRNILPKPPIVPPTSIQEPSNFSEADLDMLKKIGVDQNTLMQSLTQSVQVNFERINVYRELDRAVEHWMMGGAAELYGDTATAFNTLQNASVWITGQSEYVRILTKFLDSIGIEEKIFDWAWTAGLYGDLFIKVRGFPGAGVVAVQDDQHPSLISRVDYEGMLVGFYETPFGSGSMGTSQGSAKLLAPWDYVHIRVLGAKKRRNNFNDPTYTEYRTVHLMGPQSRQVTSKYGTSLLLNGLAGYKRLRLAEDAVLMARLTRGILKYIYKIKVSGKNIDAAGSIVAEYMNILKRARAINTSSTGTSFDERFDPLGCLRGDVKLRLCNGEVVKIRDLVSNKEKYIGKHIWTVNPETLNLEPNRILVATKTQEYAKLVRVHLDNEKYVDCTPDHKFMLRDGTYKEAQDLQPEESLMPFYSKVNSKEHEMPGYEMIYNPGKNSYVYAHRVTFYPKSKSGHPIHHCSFNKLNNDPDELERMTNKEHKQTHDDNITPELIKSRADGLKKHYETHSKTVNGIPTKGRTLEDIYGKERAQAIKETIIKTQVAWLKGKTKENSLELVELSVKHSIRLKEFYQTSEGKEVLKRAVETKRRRIASGELVMNYPPRAFRTKFCACGCGGQFKEDFRTPHIFIHGHNKGNLKKVMNHKVVRVEVLTEREDVYDITVENNHNFALANGIFVHNSVEDLFIPVWDDVNDVMIEEIGGKADIRWIVDVEDLRNQLSSAIRVPVSLLGGFVNEASGALGSEAIEALDIRFSRASRRLQRAVREGITRLCQIHLAYMNMDPDVRLFEVNMTETSTAEEEIIKKNLDTGVDVVNKFMDMLDTTGKEFDKVEILDYLNQKMLKLGDFDLQSYVIGDKIALPESKQAIINEYKKQQLEEKKLKEGDDAAGKLTRNLDLIAALPLPEDSINVKYMNEAKWKGKYGNAGIYVGSENDIKTLKLKQKEAKEKRQLLRDIRRGVVRENV